ncbi:DUF3127 domain-containing protein [Bacteroides fragilis]|nr:DUF3127 domain-containing protein [Bacteroides fragilis]
MKLEGKIIVAQPIQSGVSKNGNNWQRQDFVLEIPGQYPKKVAFSVMNSNIQNFGLAVGQDVDIEIDINANEWQGKWFNSITCWKATLRNPRTAYRSATAPNLLSGGIIHRGTRTNCHTSTASGFWGTKRRFAFLKKKEKGAFRLPSY